MLQMLFFGVMHGSEMVSTTPRVGLTKYTTVDNSKNALNLLAEQPERRTIEAERANMFQLLQEVQHEFKIQFAGAVNCRKGYTTIFKDRGKSNVFAEFAASGNGEVPKRIRDQICNIEEFYNFTHMDKKKREACINLLLGRKSTLREGFIEGEELIINYAFMQHMLENTPDWRYKKRSTKPSAWFQEVTENCRHSENLLNDYYAKMKECHYQSKYSPFEAFEPVSFWKKNECYFLDKEYDFSRIGANILHHFFWSKMYESCNKAFLVNGDFKSAKEKFRKFLESNHLEATEKEDEYLDSKNGLISNDYKVLTNREIADIYRTYGYPDTDQVVVDILNSPESEQPTVEGLDQQVEEILNFNIPDHSNH